MTAQAVVYPLDVLRRRMQLGPAARGGIVSDRTWYNQAPRARIRAHPSAPALTPPAARARQARAALCSEEGGSHVTVAGIGPTFLKAIPSAGVSATVCVSMLGFFRRSNAA
jgi:threonine dehydrogenase-like Zn-dependent dehydrogenase